MDTTLRDYARNLNAALKNKSGYTVFNRDAVHASIILYYAFLHAERQVLLLSNKLDPLIYSAPWLIDKIDRFLAKSGKIHVLVETDVDESHPIKHLATQHPENLIIKRVPDEVVKSYPYNFMVVDDRGYRFEHDRDEYSALAAFDENDQDHHGLVEDLKDIFEDLEGWSDPA